MGEERVGTEALAEYFPSPVSKEIVDKSLTEIAKNPEAVFFYETNLIGAENSQLSTFILIRADLFSDLRSSSEYMEGAVWVYRILRLQAIEKGQKLPRVSSDLVETFFRDQIQETRKTKLGETIVEMFKRIREKMTIEEPELARALREISKFRIGSEYILGGAADVYFLLKAAAEAKKLGEQFKKE